MKSIDEVAQIADLEMRIISAAKLLEFELKKNGNRFDGQSLGELCQTRNEFEENGFIRDLNFAIGVRNGIAHPVEKESSEAERQRAAQYLIDAVRRIRNHRSTLPGTNAKVDPYSRPNEFSTYQCRQQLKTLFRKRVRHAALLAFAVLLITWTAYLLIESWLPNDVRLLILCGGSILAVLILIPSVTRSLTRDEYYSLTDSRFPNGDHRCINCGSRRDDGQGISIQQPHQLLAKKYRCSKCDHPLFRG